MALIRTGGSAEVRSLYFTGYTVESIPGIGSLTVDITQYENITFIIGQGASKQFIIRSCDIMTVNEFLTTHSGSFTAGPSGNAQVITYANGTFTLGDNTNASSGVVIILS